MPPNANLWNSIFHAVGSFPLNCIPQPLLFGDRVLLCSPVWPGSTILRCAAPTLNYTEVSPWQILLQIHPLISPRPLGNVNMENMKRNECMDSPFETKEGLGGDQREYQSEGIGQVFLWWGGA